ncbi:elongation factor P [candidate division WWE3 bacterium]|nr:elongation factor P [candidate division WWE3 bacterium]
MIATGLKTGTIFQEKNQPWQVEKYSHIRTARSGVTVKVQARNLITGETRQMTYRGDTRVEDAFVQRKNAQYLYESAGYVFMDPQTYEQFKIPEKVLGEQAKYLKEGAEVLVLYYEEKPMVVEFPNTMVFEVTYTEPGFKGNTVSNVYKDAEVDGGFTVKVPSFIERGTQIKVDTRTGGYVSKA